MKIIEVVAAIIIKLIKMSESAFAKVGIKEIIIDGYYKLLNSKIESVIGWT